MTTVRVIDRTASTIAPPTTLPTAAAAARRRSLAPLPPVPLAMDELKDKLMKLGLFGSKVKPSKGVFSGTGHRLGSSDAQPQVRAARMAGWAKEQGLRR